MKPSYVLTLDEHAAYLAEKRAEARRDATTVAGLIAPYRPALAKIGEEIWYTARGVGYIYGAEALIRQRINAVIESRNEYPNVWNWRNKLPLETSDIVGRYINALRCDTLADWVERYRSLADNEFIEWVGLTQREIYNRLCNAGNKSVPSSCIDSGIKAVLECCDFDE